MNQKVGIVACSNPKTQSFSTELDMLCKELKERGQIPVISKYIFDRGDGFAGNGLERAQALMELFTDKDIRKIYDISGGDMANELLSYLDFDLIAASDAELFGYSDLTPVLNAITSMTGKESVLYQIRNILKDPSGPEYDFPCNMLQGDYMEGVLVGGNIRCLLKLAGTRFFPDLHEKILLLEARSGTAAQMVSYLSQLKMMGAFEQLNGILLGTFTQMERENIKPDIISLLRNIAGSDIPIAKTDWIGHGSNSRAVVIGRHYIFNRSGIIHLM